MGSRRRIDLFFHGYDRKAVDGPLGGVRSHLHATARLAYRSLRRRQVHTGFYTAFRNLGRGLASLGHDVHVNDFRHARRHPGGVIGLAGFAEVFDVVRLPNPAVFGPGFVPAPDAIAAATRGLDVVTFTAPCDWACAIWRPTLGERIRPLFVPIPLADWPDVSTAPKSVDVLIYDKIRWDRAALVPRLVGRLQAHLRARGLTSAVLRYGHHHGSAFRRGLREARAMAFLCEHETQGIAYQEALASGIPVLAWDEGVLRDPYERTIAPPGLVVSSVPYFDGRCGATFREPDLETGFDAFWEDRGAYRPRDFVAETLFACTMTAVHCSRIAEDLIIYGSSEFGFVRFGDGFSTGSSMMPQKRNPDVFELARGSGARALGELVAMLATVADVPVVLLLTGKADRGWIADNNAKLRAVPQTHPNVTVVDWEVLSATCEGRCFYDDGIHLTQSGQNFYADVIGKVLAQP